MIGAHNHRAVQPGVAAERLDQGDFAIQMRSNAFPLYRCDTFQPPAERQTVGWQAIKRCSFKIVNSCCCRTFVLHFTRNYISIVCISGAMHGSNL